MTGEGTGAQAASYRQLLLGILAVVGFCLVTYSHTARMGFVYDDVPLLQERSALWRDDIFKVAFGSEASSALGTRTSYYRPLLVLSLAADHRLWGESPAGFHVTNIFLHCFASVLVFLLARSLLGGFASGIAAAALFALHPVQAEAVTWITARGDILCACFMVGSFIAYLRYDENKKLSHVAISLVLFFGALLTKEMAVTLPLMIVMHSLLFHRRGRIRLFFMYLVPLCIYAGMRFMVLSNDFPGGELFLVRLTTGIGLVERYVKNVLAPVDLRVFYDMPLQREFFTGAVLVPVAVLLVAVAVTAAAARYVPAAGFGFAWFLFALLPVSGLPALIQPAMMADRYLYVPMVGIGLASGAFFGELYKRRRTAALAAGAIVLVGAATGAFIRSNAWRDQAAFRDRVIVDAPGSYFAKYFAAQKLLEQGDSGKAVQYFSETLALNPGLAEAFMGRGLAFYQLDRLGEAASDFTAALKIQPQAWQVLTNLGVVYARQGRLQEAAGTFRRSLQINPDDLNAQRNLALLNNLAVGKP